eukprot:Phypoly_transcript_03686.p1 GENE.Phypoly_transcript_03686~~Phypoly_transcript_03686.p1  ORF type:complete len:404 (+),score=38.92 Phypoly_transcript_03686:521-1732(+)
MTAPHFVVLLCGIVGLAFALPTVNVITSDSICEMTGVNIHVSYSKTTYDWTALSSEEPNNLTTLLRDLGVRWVRDGGINNGAKNQTKQWNEIYNMGIRTSFIIDRNAVNVTSSVAFYKQSFPGLIGMWEGVNEPDRNYGLPDAYTVQQKWYNALRADPYWDNVPITSPSCGDYTYYDTSKYPNARKTMDVLNMHLYTNGNPMELRAPALISTQGVQDSDGKPIFMSEFGFIGAINNRNYGFSPQYTGGDPDCTHYIDGNGVAQPVTSRTDGLSSHAIYIVRSLLEFRRLGVKYAFVYELINQVPENGNSSGTTDIQKYGYIDQERHYGLVGAYRVAKDNKLGLRIFPAFTAVKRLLAWYNDSASTKTAPTQFSFNITGNVTSNVSHDGVLGLCLLQDAMGVWT